MSARINTTSIGLFIVTGVALGVTAVLLFGSSKMFRKSRELIVYFDQTLNGLNVGAPVKFRGVTIGSVKRVMVRFNQDPNDYAMPVILEIEDELLRERMPSSEYVFDDASLMERIEAGLRATLQAESLVTGVLYVGIDINPKASAPVYHQLERIYPELPSEPTKIQQLLDNLASLDIKGLQEHIDGLILRLDQTVSQLDTKEINRGITDLLTSVNRLISNPDITNSLAVVRPTLDQYRELGAKLTSRVDPLADSVTNSLSEANRTLAQLRGAGDNLRAMLAPDSPVRNDLDRALEQLAGAAQSISSLVDFLKQHPNALITGREPQKTHP